MFFLSHCCQSPFPRWESLSTSSPYNALQHCSDLWTSCGGSSDSNLVLLLCVLTSKVHSYQNQCVFFRGSSQCPLIYSIDRICPADRVDLTCSLHSWWEGFGSSSLATLPLGFNCGFISSSECGSSSGVCSWGCPEGLGFAPVMARCAGGAVASVAGVLAAPGTQGSWWLGQQEIQCSRRVWTPVLGNMFQYSCWRTPLPPWLRSLAVHSLQGHKESDMRYDPSDPVHRDARHFCLRQLCPSRSWA